MSFVRRERQCAFTEVVQRRNIRTLVDQEQTDLRVPLKRCQHQESPTESIRCVGADARRNHCLEGFKVATLNGSMEFVVSHAVERLRTQRRAGAAEKRSMVDRVLGSGTSAAVMCSATSSL